MNRAAALNGRALKAVLGGLIDVPEQFRVSDITLDSRQVTPGAAFLACRGRTHHGLEYAERAAAAGASAILWESAPDIVPPPLATSILVREIPDLSAQLGYIADRFFDAPSARLQIAAVTGTNGKTTCAWLLAQALGLLGRRTAYLGTLGFGVPMVAPSVADEPSAGTLPPDHLASNAPAGGTPAGLSRLEHTTPDAVTLHRLLARLLADGVDSVAMEVSSHALDQDRCAGLRLHTAAFTNLTREHLDYHGSMAAYAAAKAKLLAWPTLRARVINVDDPIGRTLATDWQSASHSAATGARLFLTSRRAPEELAGSRGGDAPDYVCASGFTATDAGLTLELSSSRGSARLVSALRGEFNVENLLTVLAILLAWEVPFAGACAALARCQPPPGRMQAAGGGSLPLVLIDYAHTADALAKALAAARAHCRGRLWCVFGCGGERDPGKRAEMGRIAATAADELIVTDDNPRGEDPQQIVAAILLGISAVGGHARVIHDRGQAIHTALTQAATRDVVLVAGKGHEDYQIVGAERRAFSDSAVVRTALISRGQISVRGRT